MKTTANEYLITRRNGAVQHVIVKDIRSAADAYEDAENPVVQISRTREGLDVLLEDPAVQADFTTFVSPDGAVAGGCLAAPSAFTVEAGTGVIFQAFPAAGWSFAGWWREGVELSADETARLSVEILGDGPIVYEARFAPV